MSLFLTNLDQWNQSFDEAAPSQQYAMVKAAIDEPIPTEILEKTDFGSILLDVWDYLINNNQVEACLALVATLQQKQPELYQQNFQYLDDFVVRYYLFQGENEAVRENLGNFRTNPVQGIDSLFSLIDDLQFYQATESLVELCQAIYPPISTSNALIGNSEVEIGNLIVFNLLDQACQQLHQGEPVDWEALHAEGTEYGFDARQKVWDEISYNLTTDVETGDAFIKGFKRDSGTALRHLFLDFCRTLRIQHQISFICSRAIWEAILGSLDTQDLPAKQRAHPDGYFAIQQAKLDRYLAQLIGSFFTMQQAKAAAIVWGIPLLYEFLRDKQVISEHIFERSIGITQHFKPQFVQIFQERLWRFDFVHRWPRPNSVSEAEFTEEAREFADTIAHSTPLSDNPKDNPYASLLENFNVAEASVADKPTKTIEPPSQELPTSASSPPESPPQPPAKSPWKPPKPRKSPLMEARGLSKSKSKKSGKKKKSGKGFS